ncbi:MAG: thioredoxin domain-containing protein [Anaerolineae bacterium]|jgi:uncharacterized protein YyaL (SSP411 family)|nr:thioredoxin domain-containing protein [Anaerolineae bacterium]
MPNHLQNENSPYLLQHKDNPVDWYPWGEEAFAKAQKENKPIFLSIGYAACHWCHVMAHESFENPTTAELLNKYFVSIKVDREERPDLDHIYMSAVITMTKSGGWPMSVFLTPEGKPFYGGTYFPPVPRYNMPSFPQLLTAIAESWVSQQEQIHTTSEELTNIVFHNPDNIVPAAVINEENVEKMIRRMYEDYDWKYGGWGAAPKFPMSMRILFLLEQAASGNAEAQKLALHALDAMAQGGMYDVVGGGFARYSTDHYWLVPHFEKMLYDNALLARAYLYAYLLTGKPDYRRVCEETLHFLQREMMHPEGGFFSSMDADSEGEEGKFYSWSSDDIDAALPDEDLNQLARTLYHIPVTGNWEGKIILQQMNTIAETARYFQLDPDEFEPLHQSMRRALQTYRNHRVHPGIDDKILVSWNALALQVFAEAARYLDNETYLQIAQKNANFILKNLYADQKLLRSWRQRQAQHHAFLEDYASLGLALLSLYQSDHNPYWFQAVRELTGTILADFYVPGEGFYDSPEGDPLLIARAQNLQDNAIPSGSSQAIHLLLSMAGYEGNGEYHDIAYQTLQNTFGQISQFPGAFSNWLGACQRILEPMKEIALVGDPQDTEHQAILKLLWSEYRPAIIFAASRQQDPRHPILLRDRSKLEGKTTAYLCQQHVCQQPVTSSQELASLLQPLA